MSRPTAGGCLAPHQTPPFEQPAPSPHELNTQCRHLTPLLNLALVQTQYCQADLPVYANATFRNAFLLSFVSIMACAISFWMSWGRSVRFPMTLMHTPCSISLSLAKKKKAQMHPNISFYFSYKSLEFLTTKLTFHSAIAETSVARVPLVHQPLLRCV